MPKQYKIDEVAQVTEKLKSVEALYITEYRGLTVKEMWELRGALRKANAEYKVVHNRLTKIAMENAGMGQFMDYFIGPVAVVYVNADPAAAAKALMDFAKDHEKLVVKAGVMDNALLSAEQIKALASLPSREVLLGKLVGALSSPLYGFVRVLQGPIFGFVNVLDQIKKQKEEAAA